MRAGTKARVNATAPWAPRSFVVLLAALLPAVPCRAGPWTRDEDHFYVDLSYSFIAAPALYAADFERVTLRTGYRQHALGFYGEVGLISRWLTVSLESQLYRENLLPDIGSTAGVGDLRIGVWTGLLVSPLRVTVAFLAGVPAGDSDPAPGATASRDANLIAALLPTGNGDFNFEPRLSLGYAFGGGRWPLRHTLAVELGFWLRTNGISDGLTYHAELGTRLPHRHLGRLRLFLRLAGVESLAKDQATAQTPTGLGNGVTYTTLSAELAGRIWHGLGAAIGLGGPLRGRALAAGPELRLTLRYEY